MPSNPQKTEYAKPLTRVAYFVEMQFRSGTQYVTSWNSNITTMGHEWIGLGTLGEISAIEESESLEPTALNFTLSSPTSYLYLALGDVEEYRSRAIILSICPVGDDQNLVGTPEICWRGVMDDMSVSADGENAKINLKAENALGALSRRASFRMNAAQHRREYALDGSFDYLNDLISNPTVWLSRRFQTI